MTLIHPAVKSSLPTMAASGKRGDDSKDKFASNDSAGGGSDDKHDEDRERSIYLDDGDDETISDFEAV